MAPKAVRYEIGLPRPASGPALRSTASTRPANAGPPRDLSDLGVSNPRAQQPRDQSPS